MTKERVVLFMGGISSEREVSLMSGKGPSKAWVKRSNRFGITYKNSYDNQP